MIYTLVPPSEINRVWLKVLPHVRSLVDESDGRVSELVMYEEFIGSVQLLWIAISSDGSRVDGFISTKINQYSKIRMASLEYCAGEDAAAWFLPLMSMIERWAKDLQCDGIEMVAGRRGWTRKFREAGFRDKFTWAEKRFPKESEEYGEPKV